MGLKLNPFNRSNPLSLKDAAVIATVTAFVTWILTFIADLSMGQIRADPGAVFFEALKQYAVAWAGSFLSMSGLDVYVRYKEKS